MLLKKAPMSILSSSLRKVLPLQADFEEFQDVVPVVVKVPQFVPPFWISLHSVTSFQFQQRRPSTVSQVSEQPRTQAH